APATEEAMVGAGASSPAGRRVNRGEDSARYWVREVYAKTERCRRGSSASRRPSAGAGVRAVRGQRRGSRIVLAFHGGGRAATPPSSSPPSSTRIVLAFHGGGRAGR